MTLRTLNYGNYGIFLIMGNAGFCPSTVRALLKGPHGAPGYRKWGGITSQARILSGLGIPLNSLGLGYLEALLT